MPGPYENRPALDEVVQMMGGLAYMTGPPGQPLRAGASVIDILGGTYGVIGILTGLYDREKTGKGTNVIASLFESAAFLMGQHMAYEAVAGEPAPPMPIRVSSWSIYDRFETKDARPIFVGVTSDRHWKRFCEIFGLEELGADPRLTTNNDRIAQRSWLIPELKRVMSNLTQEEIFHLCDKAGIPFAPIAKPGDLFEDPQLNKGGGLLPTTLKGGIQTKLPRIPVRLGVYDFGLRSNPPDVGEGCEEVLESVGMSKEEIAQLRRANIIA